MTRRRWIADEVSGDRAFLLGSNAEHLSRVLRARIGQQFEVATPSGVRLGEIVEIGAERVVFALAKIPELSESREILAIHLYFAIFKFDRIEWAIEKCTELGVSNFVPVIARRTGSALAAASQKRVERWRKIVHEAAQQSRRDSTPVIAAPIKLDKVIAEAPGSRIVLSENEREQHLRDAVGQLQTVSLAIGPEGGWAEQELAMFAQNGWTSASLGPTILRAETAAIAAIAVLQAFRSASRLNNLDEVAAERP
jgi:16S rRNA (uracil1498-N3)-methyltransferase